MKLNTLDHPKTLDLCDRLDVGLAQALGHLTLLWAFTARKSPRGDVGKWSDGAIARACDWRGDSEAFVTAMVESGYLDRNEEYRLLVHDWADHAERWVKASLKNLNQTFIVATTEPTTVETTEPTGDPTPCPALPSLVQPCLTPDTSQVLTLGAGKQNGATAPPAQKPEKRKRQLPDDFTPDDNHRELAETVGVDLEAEFEQFRDYHTARGSTMKDWPAALRTWLRNAKKFNRGNNHANGKADHRETPFERGKRKRAELEARLDAETGESRMGPDAGNVRLGVD